MSKNDVERHGSTDGCKKCQDVLPGRQHSRAHTEQCRERFVNILKGTHEGRQPIEAEERRMSESIARISEADLRRVQRQMDGSDGGAAAETL